MEYSSLQQAFATIGTYVPIQSKLVLVIVIQMDARLST